MPGTGGASQTCAQYRASLRVISYATPSIFAPPIYAELTGYTAPPPLPVDPTPVTDTTRDLVWNVRSADGKRVVEQWTDRAGQWYSLNGGAVRVGPGEPFPSVYAGGVILPAEDVEYAPLSTDPDAPHIVEG